MKNKGNFHCQIFIVVFTTPNITCRLVSQYNVNVNDNTTVIVALLLKCVCFD